LCISCRIEVSLSVLQSLTDLPHEKALGVSALRKAGWRLLPLIAIGYGIAYMDRVNISFAALQMNRDLHFSASAYGFGAGLFFLSYAAFEVPSNLLLVRFGARRWLARIMFTWGLLSVGMLFVKTPHQFYVMRFLLGVAEAGFFPGVIYYLSRWFPLEQRARAVSRFYISLPLSSAVGGILAARLLRLGGQAGLAGWQWLFLVEGLPAVALSIFFLLCLPDGPENAAWLNDEERDWVRAAVGKDDMAAGTVHRGNEVAHALRQVRVWVLGLFLMCLYIGNYGYIFSAPLTIQKVTGLSTTGVGFVVAVLGVLGALAMLLNSAHSDRKGERYLHLAVPCALLAAGFAAAGLSHRAIIVLPGFACIMMGVSAIAAPVWSIPSEFLAGRSAAAGFAAVNMIAILGGFLGPYWMGLAADLTGSYQRGLLTLVVPTLIAMLIIIGIRRDAQRRRIRIAV
jgi:MFS transporter, ACS family, tartrate transporter